MEPVSRPGLYVYPDQAYVMDIVSDNLADTTQQIIVQGLNENWKYQEELIQIWIVLKRNAHLF